MIKQSQNVSVGFLVMMMMMSLSARSRPPDSHSRFSTAESHTNTQTHTSSSVLMRQSTVGFWLSSFQTSWILQEATEVLLEPPANLSSCWAVWGPLSQGQAAGGRSQEDCRLIVASGGILDESSSAGTCLLWMSYCRPW